MSLAVAIRQNLQPGAPDGVPDAADLVRINAFASTPLTADDVYVFACVMATNELRIDQPWRFGESSLKNFAADADASVPYLLQHDRYNPWNGGMTFAGYYDAASKEARGAVWLLRNFQISDEINTDTEIQALMTGLRRNFSVGPGGASCEWMCDLCNEDVFGQICPHVPGAMYDGKTATATVEQARLIELSGVDKGAVPGTVLLKARDFARGGKMAAAAYSDWCDRMHVANGHLINLPSVKPAAVTLTPPDTGKEGIPMRDRLAALLSKRGLTAMAAWVLGAKEEDLDDIADRLVSHVHEEVSAKLDADPLRAACLAAEVKTPEAFATLLADAKLGQAHSAGIRADAKAQAVRAYGPEEGKKYESACDDMPVSSLTLMAAQWKAIGDAKVSRGSRTSVPAPLESAVGVDADEQSNGVGDRLAAKARKYARVSGNGKEGK